MQARLRYPSLRRPGPPGRLVRIRRSLAALWLRITLTEVLIAMVVAGLAIGSLAKGRELIFNTRIKATHDAGKRLAAALYAYQDRYRAHPGDDPGAGGRFAATRTAIDAGDGDGVIAFGTPCARRGGPVAGENCNALHHLRLAGLLEGEGREALQPSFGAPASPAAWEHFHPRGGAAPALGLSPQRLTHAAMRALDDAFDDGDPMTGVIRCRGLTHYESEEPDAAVPDWCSAAL